MLKIDRIEDAAGMMLRLEGKLLAPWTDELRRAAALDGRRRLRLDLSHVTYVDGAGEGLLRALLDEGAEVISCSGFVAELLDFNHGEVR
jgi:anti-anti-sigma regulatory factor